MSRGAAAKLALQDLAPDGGQVDGDTRPGEAAVRPGRQNCFEAGAVETIRRQSDHTAWDCMELWVAGQRPDWRRVGA